MGFLSKKVRQVKDEEFIRSFIYDNKELWGRIADDGTKKLITNRNKFKPMGSLWIGYFDKDKCKGLAYLKKGSSTIMNVHINIPKEYRNFTAYVVSKSMLEYVEKNINQNFVKLNTQVPSIYPNVIKWAEKFGFKKYDVNKGTYLKNNKLCDCILMSKRIERSAWAM